MGQLGGGGGGGRRTGDTVCEIFGCETSGGGGDVLGGLEDESTGGKLKDELVSEEIEGTSIDSLNAQRSKERSKSDEHKRRERVPTKRPKASQLPTSNPPHERIKRNPKTRTQ